MTDAEFKPWKDLATAIVKDRVDEWRRVNTRLSCNRRKYDELYPTRKVGSIKRREEVEDELIHLAKKISDDTYELGRIEKWFRSDWCWELSIATGISGTLILERLKSEAV